MPSNIRAFTAQLENFERDIRFLHARWVRRIAEAAHRAAYLHTPIDTSRAMSGWVSQVGSPFMGEPKYTAGSKGSTFAEALQINEESIRKAAQEYSFGKDIHIRNNVPYIEILESGEGSPQAPDGMMSFALEAAYAEMRR